MPEDQDRGPFISALSWMDDIGQVPLNLLQGRFKSAGKKFIDVLGDIPDAVVPGNWIPHLSDESDRTSGSDVLGLDEKKNPIFSEIADVGLGIAANPLSFLGVRGGKLKAGAPLAEGVEVTAANPAIDAVKGMAAKGMEKLPEPLRKVYDATAKSTRRTLNLMDVPEESETKIRQAVGKGAQAKAVSDARVQQIFADMSPEHRQIAGEAMAGVKRNGQTDRALWQETGDADAFIDSHPNLRPEDAERIKQSIRDTYGHGEHQLDEWLQSGAYEQLKDAQGTPLPRNRNYSHMSWSGEEAINALPADPKMRKAAALRQRELDTAQKRLNYMQINPKMDLEFDPLKSGLSRSAQQGKTITQQALGKSFSGVEGFSVNRPDHKQKMDEAIVALGDTDEGYRLKNMWEDRAERSNHAFVQALHTGNKIFKAAATFGVVLPRMAFNVGNRAGGLWQAISNDAAKGTVGASSRRALQDLLGSVDDGLMKLFGGKKGRWEKSELTSDITHWENAVQKAQGNPKTFRKLIGNHPSGPEHGKFLQDALDNGVIDAGWVDQEKLLTKLAATPMRQRVNDFMEWPAAIAQGIEQRMRLGTFKDLMKSGKVDAASAAKTVRDTYLDYGVPGAANRMFRDIVPFGAFMSQNAKQQAGFVARHPVVGVAASQFYGSDDENIRYPWMDSGMSIPAGTDEKGNPQYVTSLRAPIEGLAQIPGLASRDIYKDVGGSLQPLLKTALSYAAGKDTFTGQEFGQNDKILGEHMGGLGRTYNNLRSTGVLQPFTGPVDQLANLIDSRKTIGERAITGLTGVKLTSVDPDMAKKIEIEEYLSANPDVMQSTRYFTPRGEEQDPGLTALLEKLNAAKAALKEKREAASIVPR